MIGVVLCIAAVGLLLAAERRASRRGVRIAKPLASAAFLLAGWEFGALESGYGRVLFLGLVLCAAGDVLLIPKGRSAAFLAGLGSFLAGHVAYAAGFVGLGLDATALALGALATGVFAAVVLRWLWPHLIGENASLRKAVVLYVVVISAMVACSAGAVGQGATLRVGLGAVGFALSDLAVARERFVSPGFANGAWGLPLYYASQLVLASSAAFA
ncbi:MAG: lysoplasmalogenase family protein [Myxococcota bacterium]